MRRLIFLIIAALAAWALWQVFDETRPEAGRAASDRATQVAGNTLRRGNGPEPESLDPHRSQIDASANILRDLFEGLTTHTPGGNVVPGTASEWEVSPDGKTYRFRIHDGAVWSNGDPLTAEDFVFSFRRLVDPATGSAYAQMLAAVKNATAILAGQQPPEALGVAAPDDRTLVVELEAPTAYFLELLTHPSTFPVHAAAIAAHGERYGRPGNLVSNGAYVLTEWVVGSHVAARRNPRYRGDAHTAIDEVRFLHIPDESTELQRYRAGELDFTYTIPVAQYEFIQANMADQLRVAPYLNTYYYGFNVTRPPFENNRGLRRALSLVIDRERITEFVTGVGEVPAYSWVPIGVNNYEPQAVEYRDWTPEQRIAEAKRLYAEAGYSAEEPLQIELRYNTGEIHSRIAAAVQSMWKEHLGVEAKLNPEEFKVLVQNMAQREVTQVFRSSWIGDYNDAYTFLEVLGSGHGANYSGYDNPDYDALLEQASLEIDPARRRALLEEAERLMLADQPLAPLYFYVSKHLVNPRVHGWADNVLNFHYSRHLSLAAE